MKAQDPRLDRAGARPASFVAATGAARGAPFASSLAPVTADLLREVTSLLGEPPLFWGRVLAGRDTSHEGATLYSPEDEGPLLHEAGIRVAPFASPLHDARGDRAAGLRDGDAHARELLRCFRAGDIAARRGEVFLFLDIAATSAPLSAEYFIGWAAGLLCASSKITVYPCARVRRGDIESLKAIASGLTEGVTCRGLWLVDEIDSGAPRPWDAEAASIDVDVPCKVLLFQTSTTAGDLITTGLGQINPSIDAERELLQYLPLPSAEVPAPSPESNPDVEPEPPEGGAAGDGDGPEPSSLPAPAAKILKEAAKIAGTAAGKLGDAPGRIAEAGRAIAALPEITDTTKEARKLLAPTKEGVISRATLVFVLASLAMFGAAFIPGLRGGVLWAIEVALMLTVLASIGKARTGRLMGVLISAQNLISLSRFQLVLWTVLLLSAYVTIILRRLGQPDPLAVSLDWRLWALMGISTSSFIGTPLLQSLKKGRTPTQEAMEATARALRQPVAEIKDHAKGVLYSNPSVEDARFTDMFEGNEVGNTHYIDLTKLQMFLFTLTAALSYGISLFHVIDGAKDPAQITSFPELTSSFIAILGIAYSGYLGGKISFQTPVESAGKEPAVTEPPAPTAPVAPIAPVAPATPVAPSRPVTPATPVTPALPVSPVIPVIPVAPVLPAPPATPAPARPGTYPRTTIPPRPLSAITGSAFFADLGSTQGQEREQAALEQLLAGNIPDFLREFVEIKLQANGHTGSVWVSPDVLAIGSDDDFVRIPLSPITAQKVHDHYSTTFVTTRLSEEIHRRAQVKLAPITQAAWYSGKPDGRMLTNEFYLTHNRLVEKARAGKPLGALTSGVKKDVCLSIKLNRPPQPPHLGRKSVVIYGWYKADGTPIQGEVDVHESTYADYSHGIRLVATDMMVDGEPMSLFDVMEDPELAPLLLRPSDIRDPSYPPPRRYPGVPQSPPHRGDDLDAEPPEPDETDSLGVRALAEAEQERGKPGWESPPGSKGGPRIAKYFAGCVRNGKPLGINKGNWCAAFACYCAWRAARPGDVIPHEYRAAVVELWKDALLAGYAWRTSEGYHPRPGDLAIYGRNGSDPTRGGGEGHVGRVLTAVDRDGYYYTIEGNINHKVQKMRRSVKETLGWIAYPPVGAAVSEADAAAVVRATG